MKSLGFQVVVDQSCLLLLMFNLQMGANMVMLQFTLVQLVVDHPILLLFPDLARSIVVVARSRSVTSMRLPIFSLAISLPTNA